MAKAELNQEELKTAIIKKEQNNKEEKIKKAKEKKEKKKGTFWKDFKAFISRGNIVDLAVAVVVGGAFGKIVTSLVNDIIMPLISAATGGLSVADWKWVIREADEAAGITESALFYGNFIQTIIDFLIIAFFIFLALRILQKSKSQFEKVANEIKEDVKKKKANKNNKEEIVEEIVPIEKEKEVQPILDNTAIAQITEGIKVSTTRQEELLTEIRDLLRKQAEK